MIIWHQSLVVISCDWVAMCVRKKRNVELEQKHAVLPDFIDVSRSVHRRWNARRRENSYRGQLGLTLLGRCVHISLAHK